MATVISTQSRRDRRTTQDGRRLVFRNAKVNVGDAERLLSAATGGCLLLHGLKRKSLGGAVLAMVGGGLLYRGLSGHCNIYQKLHVNTAGTHKSFSGLHLIESVVVSRPRTELYAFWRELSNLPRCMPHLKSVTDIDGKVSHWIAEAPAGITLEWDAKLINDIKDELIAWQSLPNSTVSHAGSVHFKTLPANRGTEVRLVMNIGPMGGLVGAAIAKAWHEPEASIAEGLRRFKATMETGEVATIEGQTSCRECQTF